MFLNKRYQKTLFFVVIGLMYFMYQQQPGASREEKELSALPAEEE